MVRDQPKRTGPQRPALGRETVDLLVVHLGIAGQTPQRMAEREAPTAQAPTATGAPVGGCCFRVLWYNVHMPAIQPIGPKTGAKPVTLAEGTSLLLEASTGHLTEHDHSRLADLAAQDMAGEVSIAGLRLVPHQYGWFVILHYPNEGTFRQALRTSGLSAGFQSLVRAGRRMGVRMVDLDQDNDPVAGIPYPTGDVVR